MTTTSKLIHGYEVVIGFETHTQLATQSKIFSRAPTAFGAEPNTQACAVDLALPGTLPVMNREAVACAIKLGLALGSHIAPVSIFARKNYFYPDLPKGYQISQFEIPVVQGGEVEFFLGDEKKTVRLVRAHLEEDAGKSLARRLHRPEWYRPEPRGHAAAGDRDRARHALVRRGRGVCQGAAQDRHLDRHLRRQHAGRQLPLRRQRVGAQARPAELGTRREIKNLNSFKFMQQAIDYEIRWQIEQIEDGHAIQQATVLFDPDTGETRAMRTKEDAADYRYFPDPDLPPLHVSEPWVAEVNEPHMAELPRPDELEHVLCQSLWADADIWRRHHAHLQSIVRMADVL